MIIELEIPMLIKKKYFESTYFLTYIPSFPLNSLRKKQSKINVCCLYAKSSKRKFWLLHSALFGVMLSIKYNLVFTTLSGKIELVLDIWINITFFIYDLNVAMSERLRNVPKRKLWLECFEVSIENFKLPWTITCKINRLKDSPQQD